MESLLLKNDLSNNVTKSKNRLIYLIYPAEQERQGSLYPPLGLAYISASLKKNGYKPVVIDLTFDKALMATLANKNNISQICTFEYLQPLFGLKIFYLPM